MIVYSLTAWLKMLAVVLLASAAGRALSLLIPWPSAAWRVGLPGAVGIALGPFMLGIASVFVLQFFPGWSHLTHLVLVVAALAVIKVTAILCNRDLGQKQITTSNRKFGEYFFFFLISLWLIMLFVNSIFIPLLQNDALEYATVGRLLYEARDLSAYPAINPEQSTSGFFGPWTHPPLYVSLIYLTQTIQGNADEPGFMRLIAPWFAACATLLIFALGSLVNRMTGLIAALVFLSTPLMFTGADSALVDALPVLGICLVVTAILCVDASPMVRGAIVGIALALALWTHSQAVLFLPLAVVAIVLQNGARGFRSTIQETVSLSSVVLLFGAWPYWRNLKIFGSPISDNPAVFAMPSLDWRGYFTIGRGLDGWIPSVQYGLLKGWFSLEAYGWAFWLMTLGAGITFKYLYRSNWRATLIVGGRKTFDLGRQALWVSLIFIFVYLSGVLLSILAGLDLMIKNERYMLVILPLVAILAGYGSQELLNRGALFVTSPKNSTWRRETLAIGGMAITLVLFLQLFLIAGFYRWRWSPSQVDITLSDNESAITHKMAELTKSRFRRFLEVFPNALTMYWVRENLPHDALVLSLRPADMYYAQRKMVSYLDERLLPVYQESSPLLAMRLLRELGITHLHVPDYGLPVSYNSVLDRIIDDPELSRLIYSAGGTQILQLQPIGETQSTSVVVQSVDFTPPKSSWTRYLQINLAGRKALGALGIGSAQSLNSEISNSAMSVRIFHRDFSTILANGLGQDLDTPRLDSILQVKGSREYRVTFKVEGDGLIKIWLAEFDARGLILSRSITDQKVGRISEIVLTECAGTKRVSRRFLTSPHAAYVRFGIEHVGHSKLKIKEAVLENITNN